MAALWKQADAEEKSPFEKEASALKEKYIADIKAFKSGPQAKFIAENPGCDKKPEESSSEEEDSSDEDSSGKIAATTTSQGNAS